MNYQIENQIKQLRDKTRLLQDQNKQKQKQKIQLQKQINSLTAINKLMRTQHDEYVNKIKFHRRTSAQIGSLSEQIKIVSRQLEHVANQNNQIEQENSSLYQNINILKQNKQFYGSSPSSPLSHKLTSQDQQIHRLYQLKSQLEQKIHQINQKNEAFNIYQSNHNTNSFQDKQKQNNQYIADLYESEVRIKDKIIEHLQSKIKQYEKQLGVGCNGQVRYSSIMEVRKINIDNTELEHRLNLLNRENRNLKKRIRKLETQSVGIDLALVKHTELAFNLQKQRMLLNDKIQIQSQENRTISNLRSNLLLLQQKIQKIKQKDCWKQNKNSEEITKSEENIVSLKKQVQELQNKISEGQRKQERLRIDIEKQNQDLLEQLEKHKKLNDHLLAQIEKRTSQSQQENQMKPTSSKTSNIQLKINGQMSQEKQIKNILQLHQFRNKRTFLRDAQPELNNLNETELKSAKSKVQVKSKSLRLGQKIQQKKPLTLIEEKIKKLKLKNQELKLQMPV